MGREERMEEGERGKELGRGGKELGKGRGRALATEGKRRKRKEEAKVTTQGNVYT